LPLIILSAYEAHDLATHVRTPQFKKTFRLIFIGLLLIPSIEGIYCWVYNIKMRISALFFLWDALPLKIPNSVLL
jgi:hypothetical protein